MKKSDVVPGYYYNVRYENAVVPAFCTGNISGALKMKLFVPRRGAKKRDLPYREVGRVYPNGKSVVGPLDRLPEWLSDQEKTEEAPKDRFSRPARCPHLVIEARAGSGKTTTLVQGIRAVIGLDPTTVIVNKAGLKKSIDPSEQQSIIWTHMAESKVPVERIAFVAFNRSIADELQKRVPTGANAMTMHSLGRKAVYDTFGHIDPDSRLIGDLVAEELEMTVYDVHDKYPDLIRVVDRLVSLAKGNLTGVEPGHPYVPEDITKLELDDLCRHYGVEANGNTTMAYKLTRKCLRRCLNPKDQAGRITFDDMIWLPVVLGLAVRQYELLLVDEAQDLNRAQQALAQMAGRRLILCGDPHQAIYGFAGADADSMPRMTRTLSETKEGCKTLQLSYTYRCGHAIVEEAQRIVPEFYAGENNPPGLVARTTMEDYREKVQDGDMAICRVNAPLIGECFKIIGQGRKAYVQGRDIGNGLIKRIKKLKASDVADLREKVNAWYLGEVRKENNRRNPSEARLISLEDQYHCIEIFTLDAQSIDEVIRKIEKVFTDDSKEGIRFSSIHKAKGLEARRVFLLEPSGSEVPHPMATKDWEKDQEMNLRYVAITRAIEELYLVHD